MKVDASGEAADGAVLKIQGGAGVELNPTYSRARTVNVQALQRDDVVGARIDGDAREAARRQYPGGATP